MGWAVLLLSEMYIEEACLYFGLTKRTHRPHWANEWLNNAPAIYVNIVSDSGLSPERHQAIIWTNADLLSIGPLVTGSNKHFTEITKYSLTKM